jgi:lipoprotein NlpI
MRRRNLRVVLSMLLLVSLGAVSRTWADAAEDAYNDGLRLFRAGQSREALAAFDKAIRLKPTYVEAYYSRGKLYHTLKQYEQALKDYDEVVRLKPDEAEFYYARANVYSDAGQPARALNDYDSALRLNSKLAPAHYNRSLAHFALGQGGEAAADARAFLAQGGWQESNAPYMVLVGYIGEQQAHHEKEARQLLDEAAGKCNRALWPYPIIGYLQREITADALLAAATDTDKQTEARTYLGLDLSLSGHREEALTQLRWVKDNGNKGFTEYSFATTALQHLEAAPQPQP